jgi:ABC-2 type transport system ATP-binding protein
MRQRVQAQRVVRIGLMAQGPDELGEIVEKACAWLEARSGVTQVKRTTENRGEDLEVTFAGQDEGVAELLGDLVGAGFPVLSFQEETGDLEDVFMRLTQGIVS